MKKIKKSVYLVMALLLAAIGFTTYKVVAWLTDTDTKGPVTFTVGEVSYTWSGTPVTNEGLVVPGEQLLGLNGTDVVPATLTNASNVNSQLRVKITISVVGVGENNPINSDDARELVLMPLGSDWYLLADDYYYYDEDATGDADASDEFIIPATNTTAIPVITSLMLDGSKVGNDYARAVFSVTLTFEAKQGDFVTWAALGTANIDFTTGIAAVNP